MRIWIIGLLAIVMLCILFGFTFKQRFAQKPEVGAVPNGFAVVELFTSEGCSSCPPADDLLTNIIQDKIKAGVAVYALSFHVDYWNRLRWKDSFSTSDYSLRQSKYGEILKEESYTPQAVVNGKYVCVGSDKIKLLELMRKAGSIDQVSAGTIKIESVSRAAQSVTVKYSLTGGNVDNMVCAAITEDNISHKIKAGENGGRVLVHNAVVRQFVANKSGDRQGEFKLKNTRPAGKGPLHLVLFVQNKSSLRIVAATGKEL